MLFKYKAKKSLTDILEGKVEAASLEDAIEQLARQGVIPIEVDTYKEQPSENSKKENISNNIPRWNTRKLTFFTQKLYSLVRAGVELLSALRLMQQESTDPTEKQLLEEIIKNIKEGGKLSECFAKYPRHFSLLYVNIIKAGETTGQLKDSLTQLLVYLKRIEELRSKVTQALAYPLFMVVVGIATIFIMLSFIMPKLVVMFDDFGATLPLPTRILLAVSHLFENYWWAILGGSFLSYFIIEKIFGGRDKLFTYLKYNVPVIKDLVYKQSLANFSSSLSLLLKSGVTLLSALVTAAPIIGNPVFVKQIDQVRQDIREGVPFSQAVGKFNIFPRFFLQMIRVGEEAGRLDNILFDIAESYEKEIEADLKIVSSLLEPAIILMLGTVIGAMVIAVLLPIFNVNDLVSR